MIDKSSTIPLYLQLVEIILEQIKTGLYTEGEKIPSERELSEIFNISRATVRQALSELEKIFIKFFFIKCLLVGNIKK